MKKQAPSFSLLYVSYIIYYIHFLAVVNMLYTTSLANAAKNEGELSGITKAKAVARLQI